MDILLLLLRIGLAGVMALAGFAKLADLSGSRKAFKGFGLKGPLAKFGPVALSLIEISIAAALLFTQFAWYGASAALTLLIVFIAQMGYQLAKGNAPDCHCFGQVYSAPVSPISVIRNLVFAIPAAVLLARGQTGQGASVTDPSVNTLELVFAVVVAAFLLGITAYLRKILQRQDQILKELEIMDIVAREGGTVERNEAGAPREGLPIGAVVPDLELKDLAGHVVSLADLKSGGLPVLFVFVSPNCTPCRSMLPSFQKWVDDLSGKVRLAFITSGSVEENVEKFGETLGGSLYLQEGHDVATVFRATWTPSAVFMGRNGRIASQIAAGDQAIRTLLESIENENLESDEVFFTNGNAGASKAPVGEPVPEFSLSDTEGREITSAQLKGKQTLITFWSPTCGYCKAMADDLMSWERSRGAEDPDLIVLTPAEDSLQLESPVLIDPESKTATKLGMQGTPSAILVNEKGIVASETAIGAQDIWALVGKRK
jgi:thiol-disulfide isomerase/thioredoxin